MEKSIFLKMVEITDSVADQENATPEQIMSVAKEKAKYLHPNAQIRVLPKRGYTLFNLGGILYIGRYEFDQEEPPLFLRKPVYTLTDGHSPVKRKAFIQKF